MESITTFLKKDLFTVKDAMPRFTVQMTSLHRPVDGQVLMMRLKMLSEEKLMLMEEESRSCVQIVALIWAMFLKEKDSRRKMLDIV